MGSIKHRKTSTIPNALADTQRIGGDDWNNEHEIDLEVGDIDGLEARLIPVDQVVQYRDDALAYRNEAGEFRNEAEGFAQDAQSYVGSLAATDGATKVGTVDGVTVEEALSIRVRKVETIAALRLLPKPLLTGSVVASGYYSANDGGGGAFAWDDASTLPDNNGSVIKPTAVAGAGRWRFAGVADIRRYGAKPDDPAFNNLAAFKASLATSGIIQLNAGNYYNVNIASEADTLTGDIEIQFNGPAIRHTAPNFVLINSVGKRLTFKGVARLIFAGTYPPYTGQVSKYGDPVAPSITEANYCGFIRYGGVGVINIERIEAVGETDANLYDFVMRGASGTFYGSSVGSIFASHYARALADNTVGMHFGFLEGTKRHNNSMQHYGQGHYAYINLIDARIDSVREYGPIIQGPSLKVGFDASVQITAFNNSSIGDITTTMDACSAFSLKGEANNWRVGSIVSKSEGFNDVAADNTVLVDIQTNLEATVLNGEIENCTVYLPISSVKRTGFWAGGSRLTANVTVVSPDSGAARPAGIVNVVTCANSKINIRTVCTRADDFLLLGKSASNVITIDNAGLYAGAKTGPSMTGSTWGASTKNTITYSGSAPASGPAKVDWITDAAAEPPSNIVQNAFRSITAYAEQRLQAGVISASIDFPIRTSNKNAAYTNDRVNAYRLYLTANDQLGVQTGYAEYRVILRNDGASSGIFEIQQIYLYSSGAGGDAFIFSVTGLAGVLTATASMGTGTARVFGITALLERVSHIHKLN